MKYYILYNDENRGPLELEELEEFGLNPKSRVWAPGWSNWQDAGDVPEIQEYLTRKESEARKLQEEQLNRERQRQQQAERAEQSEQAARAAWEKADKAASETAATTVQQPEISEIEWYIAVNDQEVGPVKQDELSGLGLTPDTLVWNDNLTSWTPARDVPELAALLSMLETQAVVSPLTPAKEETYTAQHTGAPAGNPYTAALIAVAASIAAIITVFLKGEYYDGDEKAMLCLYCAGAPFLLTIGSLIYSKKNAASGMGHAASRQVGLSIGLAVGAILASIVGIAIALQDFELI